MVDRIIGLSGIALTILFGTAQFYITSIPTWASISGVLLGVLLLGVSLGLFFSHKKKKKLCATANLRLHIWGDHRAPDKLEANNIFRWYYLQTFSQSESDHRSSELHNISNTLFISFGDDVKISTCKVQSPDMKLPLYEVKDFNQRYAIIVFSGAVTTGTLEVSVS